MHPELAAFCAEALRDETTGLNAQAELLDSELPACAVVTALEQGWAARLPFPEEVLAEGPVCIVRQADDYEEGSTAHDQPSVPEIPVAIIVAMRESATDEGLAVVQQLLRCARRSLKLAFANLNPPLVSRPDGTEIEKPSRDLHPLTQPVAASSILLAMSVLLFPVYDPWALGAHVPSA